MDRLPHGFRGAALHHSGMQYVFLYIIWDSIYRNRKFHSIFFVVALADRKPCITGRWPRVRTHVPHLATSGSLPLSPLGGPSCQDPQGKPPCPAFRARAHCVDARSLSHRSSCCSRRVTIAPPSSCKDRTRLLHQPGNRPTPRASSSHRCPPRAPISILMDIRSPWILSLSTRRRSTPRSCGTASRKEP